MHTIMLLLNYATFLNYQWIGFDKKTGCKNISLAVCDASATRAIVCVFIPIPFGLKKHIIN